MEEFNIKCNNEVEAKFIEKYFLNNEIEWNDASRMTYKTLKSTEYPIIISNFEDKYYYIRYKIIKREIHCYYYRDFNYYPFKIIEAKQILREEKLNKINGTT